MSDIPARRTGPVRWMRGTLAVVLAFGVAAPYATFKARTWWAAERLVRDLNQHADHLDPPGSDDTFPNCFGPLLGELPPRPDDACRDFEVGKQPRAQMPATCRTQLDALVPWSDRVLDCADGVPRVQRSVLIALSTAERFDQSWAALITLRKGARHVLAESRIRNDAERAQRLCTRLVKLDQRFAHFNWSISGSQLVSLLEGDCLWAASATTGDAREGLQAAAARALRESPSRRHLLEDLGVAQRAGTFGGYATHHQQDAVDARTRPMMGLEMVSPDDFPRQRHVRNQLGWPAFDLALTDLAKAADEAPSAFAGTASRVADGLDRRWFIDSWRTSAWVRDAPKRLAEWQQRLAALEAIATTGHPRDGQSRPDAGPSPTQLPQPSGENFR